MTTGHTHYRPIGFKIEYTHIDLKEKIVKAIVKYEGQIIMTVTVDLHADSIQKVGGLEEVSSLETYGVTEQDTLREIKCLSEFFIQNNISNPKEYYEQFK